jgi:hypothetical protein
MTRPHHPDASPAPLPAPNAAKPAAAQRNRFEFWLFLLGLLCLLALLFRQVLVPGQTLFSMDDNAGFVRYQQGLFPEAIFGGWYDLVRVGTPLGMIMTIFIPLIWVLPATVYIWAIYAIYMLLGGLFLGLYLRERGCNWPAALLGALTAFFVGSNFTLIYAGHLQKFAILMNAGLYLWLLEVMARTRRTRFALLAGGALAFPFLHQMDVALFVALFLGAYTVYVWVRDRLFAVRFLLRLALPLGAMALLTVLHALRLIYGIQVQGVAALETEPPERQWDLATQWSWPPDEIIDAVAPGYFGWRSGEPAGPYYGRVGRSPDWIPQPYWSPNHKGESTYLGLLPVMFALGALWLAWRRRRLEPGAVRDVWFWAAAALVALVLSFGRYGPLYALFYKLPIVSSIRNPNKFVQIFQFALGILAAHGLTWTLRAARADGHVPEDRAALKPLAFGALVAATLFVLAFLSAAFRGEAVAAAFGAQGWPRAAADAIAAVRAQALGHAALMGFLTAGLVLALMFLNAERHRRWLRGLAWAAALLVAADALLLARHYLKTTGTAYYDENELVRAIRSGDPLQRTLMTHQEAFYNHWLTFYFPFHHLQTWNVTQMPREPTDYRNFRAALQSDQNMRLWQFCAVGHILTPVAYRERMAQADPAWRDDLELVMAYQVARDPVREFRIVPAQPGDQTAQGIYRFKRPAPRFALLAQWEETPDDQALTLLASPAFAPLSRALVAPHPGLALPQPSGATQATVAVRSYRSGNIRLETQTDGPALLRFAEKHDPSWTVQVDGRPASLLRVDYLFQGVLLPPGEHEVTFRYSAASPTIWLQFAAMAVWLAAALFAGCAAWISRRKSHLPCHRTGTC